MGKKKTKRQKIAHEPLIIILGLVLLIIAIKWAFLGIVPIWQSWQAYQPKCRALADNIRLFVPNGWQVSAEFPVYDGGTYPPTTQAHRDFRDLVSQCQLLIGFKNKPAGYQEVTPNNYGTITLKVDKVNAPKDLQSLKSTYPYSETIDLSALKTTRLKNHEILIPKSGPIDSYVMLHNQALVKLSLNIHPRANNNPRVQNYLRQTFADLFDRLILLD